MAKKEAAGFFFMVKEEDLFFAAEEDSFAVANFPSFVISDCGRGGGRGGEMNEETANED